MSMKALVAVTLVMACGTVPATQGSGEPLRIGLRLDESPRVGSEAPSIVLPYATSAGVGPSGQPFDLRRELGLVVVLSFCRHDYAEECLTQWRTFRDQQPVIFGSGVTVVGVSADSLTGLVRFATAQDLPFKFVSDPTRDLVRRLGFMTAGAVRHTVVVVGREGRVRYIDAEFAALESRSYNNLAAAIKAAKES